MGEMHGARRVITFCLLTAVLPTVLLVIPLYLRHSLFADVSYSVAESDVLEAVEGISTVFCQEQILRMNTTFRAFQLEHMPPLSNQRKHIQLKKSMILPDDTVEYWGFYLLAGSNISLLACSRFEGAGVLVVKGEKNLKNCQNMELYTKVKYQKSGNGRKLHKGGNSRETRASKLKGDMVAPQIVLTDIKDATTPASYNTNEKSISQGHDPLDEFTKGVKEYINNYPKNREAQRNKSIEDPKEHLPKNQRQSESAINVTKLKDEINPDSLDKIDSTAALRHKRAINQLMKQLQDTDIEDNSESIEVLDRPKRKTAPLIMGHILDAGVGHGGNANVTEGPEESSDSSFEDSLRRCYDGQDLFSKAINPSPNCYSNYSLDRYKIDTLPITSDGYYYFIFYSDNDYNDNPVHAHFDIFKTTYQHTNFTRGCVNHTECKFPITFWSNEIVIVEVPTRDGIEHEDGDASVLVSSCYPRMAIYAIFPVAVLFLILGCAFL